MNWYFKVLKQYVDFRGRARRKEYWMFTLFHFIIIFILVFLGAFDFYLEPYTNNSLGVTSIIFLLYLLATLIPNLAVTVRRLHDTGRSGWWYLIIFVPYVGNFVILIFTCFESEYGSNKWGPNPKGLGNEDSDIDKIGTE